MQATREHRAEAARIYSGEWDADGTTSVYLPKDIAAQLLEANGWERDEMRRGWVSPEGEQYWEVSDCLAIELSAQALASQAPA